MNNKLRIYIFGTGSGAEELLSYLDLNKVVILGFLDNDLRKHGETFNDGKIMGFNELESTDYDKILIASESYAQEMRRQLIGLGIPKNKIFSPLVHLPKSGIEMIRKTFNIYKEFNKYCSTAKIQALYNDYAISTTDKRVTRSDISIYDYPDYPIKGIDFVRISTMEFLAKEINEKKLSGAVAELGVYRGDFSKLISKLFPENKLYLFDTFEGFNEEDIKIEEDFLLSNATEGRYGNTSINLVLEKISRTNVEVKKGYFPDTTKGLEDEKFSFVSLDVDLYKPTYEGLSFFYPRLEKGGYIMIHDYNLDYYKGVKKAVREFCEEKNINIVPISDYFGSAIITK
ncbi:TylF/MycF/NovP-related O-methyltransferase [Cytobacillus gottheilii]|uniref:TylF/MycF/NovP-related O-methyltransferase n=1 Tax=Cytobacillus gottheilii TaxID=859144 RepID=UPI003CEA5EF2